MSDTTTTILTASGVAVLGVNTGLQPALLVAGFIGALWAQSYQPTSPWYRRAFMLALSPLLAGYFAPLMAAWLHTYQFIQGVFTQPVLQLPAAVLVGLMAHEIGYRALTFIRSVKADKGAQ